jgi:hypothetical protein
MIINFISYNLTAGTHYIDFYSTNYILPQIRIDISGKTNRYRAFAITPSAPSGSIEGFGYVQTPISAEPLIHVKPLSTAEYFEKEESFDPLSLLKNPMVITLIVGLGIAVLAPKLVDPEAMKEVQASMSQNEADLKNVFSSLTTKDQQSNQSTKTGSKKVETIKKKK